MDSERTVALIVLAILVFSALADGPNAQESHATVQSGDAEKGQVGKAEAAPVPRIFFRDVASEVGVTTAPSTNTDRRYVLEAAGGGGIALFDCDNDGKLDLAVVNDSTIEQYRKGGDLMITLYHQDGNGSGLHFTDVTKMAGLTARGWGMGIAVGDYDNDRLPDLYVTGYGHNVLYHNLGNCEFEDVTAKAGLQGGGFSTGAAWADDAMEGETDLLFRNRGDGTFVLSAFTTSSLQRITKRFGLPRTKRLPSW